MCSNTSLQNSWVLATNTHMSRWARVTGNHALASGNEAGLQEPSCMAWEMTDNDHVTMSLLHRGHLYSAASNWPKKPVEPHPVHVWVVCSLLAATSQLYMHRIEPKTVWRNWDVQGIIASPREGCWGVGHSEVKTASGGIRDFRVPQLYLCFWDRVSCSVMLCTYHVHTWYVVQGMTLNFRYLLPLPSESWITGMCYYTVLMRCWRWNQGFMHTTQAFCQMALWPVKKEH